MGRVVGGGEVQGPNILSGHPYRMFLVLSAARVDPAADRPAEASTFLESFRPGGNGRDEDEAWVRRNG